MAEATKRLSRSANEALDRATNGQALTNYPAIFEGFMARGIPEAQIKPRENVFTFQAWRALGRSVRKGEQGVRVVTFVLCESKQRDPSTGEETIATYRRPHTTTVFHISQTEECKADYRTPRRSAWASRYPSVDPGPRDARARAGDGNRVRGSEFFRGAGRADRIARGRAPFRSRAPCRHRSENPEFR